MLHSTPNDLPKQNLRNDATIHTDS
jgi:hypothetical protein